MSAIREKARQILSQVPPLGQIVTSVGPTATLFTQLTGTSHKTLADNWATGGIMTTCNGFTGVYSRNLGSKEFLGRFDLDTYLPKIGKGHAWIKSSPDVRPKYGDIVRYAKFHVGVSEHFDGDIWNHIDSGQGGKSAGMDILKRIKDTVAFDYKKLMGWVDIDLYFDCPADDVTEQQAAAPVPEWLLGWWNVSWRGQAFYYCFDRTHQVKWTQIPPRDTRQPAVVANDTGAVSVDAPSTFSIRWGATGSIEKFNRVLAANAPMRGTWNDSEPLTAVKM